MAKIDVQNINYIVTGKKQKILNLDVCVAGTEPLKNMTFFTDTEHDAELSSAFKANDSSTAKFPNPNQFGCMIMDSNSLDSTGNRHVLRALYDSKDVAFKSAVAKNISRNVPDEDNTIDSDIDIYFPHLLDEPLGFVQLHQYGYGITDGTKISPVMLGTNLKDQRNTVVKSGSYSSKPSWQFNLNPYDRVGSTAEDPGTIENIIPLYLYTSIENLQKIVDDTLEKFYGPMLSAENLSAEAIAKWNDEIKTYRPISYYAFKKFAEVYLNDDNVLTNFFKPVYNFQNIEHNYIFEVPITDALGEFNNLYSKAQIKADIIMAKNAYDDIYNTNVSAVGNFSRIRQYVGIGNCGGKIFLKYFDDRSYETENEFEDDKNYLNSDKHIEDVPMKNTNDNSSSRSDYMKIENIKSINRFISSAMHKANLYSVKVYGLDDLLDGAKYTTSIKDKIKKDVDNSIRRIVKNFAPAHTQYFGVVDWSTENYNSASQRVRC